VTTGTVTRDAPRGFVVALALTVAASAVFYWRQNYAGQVGGPISIEKSLWLNYTITAWFVVPAFLVRHAGVDRALRIVLGSFLASMLARGVIELWLIYVAFGWSPIYGIAHDALNITLIAALRGWFRPGLAALDPFNVAVRRFLTVVQASFVAEIAFAALFYRMAVHQDAVYFAAPTEEFAHINRLTGWVDIAVYAHLAWFVLGQRARLLRRRAVLREGPA